MAYVISNRLQHTIETLSDVNSRATHSITCDKREGVLRSAMLSQGARQIKKHEVKNEFVKKKVKSSMAKSLPVENLLPQNVGSIINYLQ